MITTRLDLNYIQNWVQAQSTVLDCGCGDGDLLSELQRSKQVLAYGIENEIEQIKQCVNKGINVIQQNLEQGLAMFANKSFDAVILSQTLQTIHNTEHILQEIVRVGKNAIVTFPNFGYWQHRIGVIKGRMPISKSLPYDWYNTPNVRVLTLYDFEKLADKVGLKLIQRVVLHNNKKIKFLPNLRGSTILYLIKSKY